MTNLINQALSVMPNYVFDMVVGIIVVCEILLGIAIVLYAIGLIRNWRKF